MPNLYLIQAPERSSIPTFEELLDYQDMYDSAVVCACSEAEAKCIHPNGHYIFANGSFASKQTGHIYPSGHFFGWTHPNKVKVTFIGVSSEHMQTGTVILASVRVLE